MNARPEMTVTTMKFNADDKDLMAWLKTQTGLRDNADVVRLALRESAALRNRAGLELPRVTRSRKKAKTDAKAEG